MARDVWLIQNDRGAGKTTALLEYARELLDRGEAVAVLTADDTRARWLQNRARDEGFDEIRRLPLGVFAIMGERSAYRLRGTRHRILVDDVDDWPDGIDSPALLDLVDRLELVTSSPAREPTLAMIRRVIDQAREADRRRRYAEAREARRFAEVRMLTIMRAQIHGLSYAEAVELADAVEVHQRPHLVDGGRL